MTKLGGDCQLIDSKGSNAFHYLASNPIDKSSIEASLKDANAASRVQLIEAAFLEQSKFRNQLAEILLKAGCSPNAENSELETPFFAAIAAGNLSFARYLIEKVNVRIAARQSPSGKTLMSLMAEKSIELDICEILMLEESAQVQKNLSAFRKMARIRNENGLTPFQIVCIKLNEAALSPGKATHKILLSESLKLYCSNFRILITCILEFSNFYFKVLIIEYRNSDIGMLNSDSKISKFKL